MKAFIYIDCGIKAYENVERITFDRNAVLPESNHEGSYTLELKGKTISFPSEKVFGIEILEGMPAVEVHDEVLSGQGKNRLVDQDQKGHCASCGAQMNGAMRKERSGL